MQHRGNFAAFLAFCCLSWFLLSFLLFSSLCFMPFSFFPAFFVDSFLKKPTQSSKNLNPRGSPFFVSFLLLFLSIHSFFPGWGKLSQRILQINGGSQTHHYYYLVLSKEVFSPSPRIISTCTLIRCSKKSNSRVHKRVIAMIQT